MLFGHDRDKYSNRWDRWGILVDEGTFKTPIPKCRLYWSFLFGVVCSNFKGSESGQKHNIKLLKNMVSNTENNRG
jgi:hypothetical protein